MPLRKLLPFVLASLATVGILYVAYLAYLHGLSLLDAYRTGALAEVPDLIAPRLILLFKLLALVAVGLIAIGLPVCLTISRVWMLAYRMASRRNHP